LNWAGELLYVFVVLIDLLEIPRALREIVKGQEQGEIANVLRR